jgi:type III secretion protein U
MSNKDVQERTEPPTPRRLRKLREKGSVAKSKDLASAAVLTGILTVFCIAWFWYLDQCKEIIAAIFPFIGRPFREAAMAVAEAVGMKAIFILGPILLVTVLLAVIASRVQIGALFSIHPVLPKMERLNPAEGLKRMFSLPHLVEGAKAVIKTLVLGGALYFLLKGALQPLVMLPFHGLDSVVQITVRLSQHLFLVTIIVFIAMSLVDVIVQKRLFLHENRMSKYDVKRDYREMEGDPRIKSRRRFLHTSINTPEPGDDASG